MFGRATCILHSASSFDAFAFKVHQMSPCHGRAKALGDVPTWPSSSPKHVSTRATPSSSSTVRFQFGQRARHPPGEITPRSTHVCCGLGWCVFLGFEGGLHVRPSKFGANLPPHQAKIEDASAQGGKAGERFSNPNSSLLQELESSPVKTTMPSRQANT